MPRSRLSSWLVALGGVVGVSVAPACATKPNPPVPVTQAVRKPGLIREINLLAVPVALNFDQVPGVDGFVIKVFASNPERPKPFAIEKGQLEVLMFDGVPGTRASAPTAPLKTWRYTAAELRPFQIETSIGIGYQLAQTWADAKPARNRISVIARYTAPEGSVITSAPSIISVALK